MESKITSKFSVNDFNDHIERLTQNFTGREWVFQEIDHWLDNSDAPRYFIITGAPGIGKSSVAAKIIQKQQIDSYHFCIARQSETIDPFSFVRSISHQLCKIDGFAMNLLQNSNISIDAQQNISENYGLAINIKIDNLILNAPSASTAFTQSVIQPLKILYSKGYQLQIIILVDALDEAVRQEGAETIVTLLENAQGLPKRVRFILTTRPDADALRFFKELNFPYFLLDAGREENLKDISQYVGQCIKNSNELQIRLHENNISIHLFIERVTTASQGNFLYIAWLLKNIAEGTHQLDKIDHLPKDLYGIYREFLRTRSIGEDRKEWERRYRPIFGLLAAAMSPLTIDQLIKLSMLSNQEVNDLLIDLEQFLDPIGKRHNQYFFFHQSVRDFLGSKEKAEEFSIDLNPIHQHIIAYYKNNEQDWNSVNWNQIDDYGIIYLPLHIFSLRHEKAYIDELFAFICKAFMNEKQNRFGTYPLAEDVNLIIECACLAEPPDIVQLIRGCLIYATIVSQSNEFTEEAVEVLARSGQIMKAKGFAALIQDPYQQSRAYGLLSRALLDMNKPQEAIEVLKEAKEKVKDDHISEFQILNIEAMILKGADEQALKLTEEVRDNHQRITAFTEIAIAKAKRGELDQALSFTNQIKDNYNRIEAIAKFLFVTRKLKSLSEIVRFIKLNLPQNDQKDVISWISQQLAKENSLDDALLFVQQFEEEKIKANALGNIARTLLKKRQVDQALTIEPIRKIF